MLRIAFSNRFEVLLDGLVDALAETPASPFEAQHVVVPSMAVRRRIELELADRVGICANVAFSFLGAWLWRQIGRLVRVGDVSPFAPDILVWRIYAMLGERAFVADHPRLHGYLLDADPRMRYDLALRTALLFDQYITYRPDWLARWSTGKRVTELAADAATARADERWQAALWRRIARGTGTAGRHPSAAFFDAIDAAGGSGLREAGIPARVDVFCLPAVPPLYLNMLRRLSRHVDVRVAALDPCREYWFDIVEPRRLARLAARDALDHHEVGNPLLASWGRQRKAQLSLLFDDAGEPQVDDDRFVANGNASLLARTQDAILDLAEIGPGSLADAAADDRSIEIHVCHSPTRELEALHDHLLSLFAADATLRPCDILVVTPALDDAAARIDAVFGTVPPERHIPYVVTGRAASRINAAARALLDLLALAASRVPASAIVEVLQQPIVARRFALGDAELERIRAWIRASGARFALDAAHRAACGLPPTARHTFDDALHRLFLGYALPTGAGAEVAPFAGRLPAGDAQGSDALALGSFAAFVEAIARLRRDVATAKSAGEWTACLMAATSTFLAPEGEDVDDLRDVHARIGAQNASMQAAGIAEDVPLDVVRTALESALDDPARGGVPSGAVTFAAMSSLRDLPFRVVCILGLDDGAFPRTAEPAEFDLMAAAPRRGDRQRRDDDRSLFLDLLLAARERLYLSYVGRSVRDNAPLAPSVLIAELLDVLVPGLAPVDAGDERLTDVRRRLVVEHPLQPFSVDCFAPRDPRLRSFDAEYCAALKQGLEADAKASDANAMAEATSLASDDDARDDDDADAALAPFFTASLPPDATARRSVTIDELVRFFRNPCAYVLRERIGIRLDDGEENIADDEPFVADFRARIALADRLLPAYLSGRDRDAIVAFAHAGTEYPAGHLGVRLLERELAALDAFARALAPDVAAPSLPPLAGSVSVALDGGWDVTGAFSDLRPAGLVRFRYDDTRPTDYLEGWLRHVFLNLLAPPGVERFTRWHSRDGRYLLRPLDGAADVMRDLVALYARGLAEPLHFFPKSAWELARTDSLANAAAKWHGNGFGEKEHRAYRLALRGIADPLDDAFEECAHAVFGPLLACIVDPRIER